MSTIELTRTDGEWRALDTETGVAVSADSRGAAVRSLGESLEASDAAEELTELTAETRARFEEHGVTESDVEDAIERARS